MTISRNPHVPLGSLFMCCKCRTPRPQKGKKKTARGWICLACLEVK